MRNKKTLQLTTMAFIIAFAMILSFVESRIPAFVAIPGVKVGLANIAVIFTLYKLGIKEAIIISIIRVLLISMLFGSPVSLISFPATSALSALVISSMTSIVTPPAQSFITGTASMVTVM